jgi:hypothetical protein
VYGAVSIRTLAIGGHGGFLVVVMALPVEFALVRDACEERELKCAPRTTEDIVLSSKRGMYRGKDRRNY